MSRLTEAQLSLEIAEILGRVRKKKLIMSQI